MKLIPLLCTILMLTTFPAKSAADRPLEGCVDANAIAALLTKIRETGWQGISLGRLQSMWPTELTDIECDSHVSRSVISQDRIIKGHCQCCATFSFKVRQKQDEAISEQLDGIIINYSASRRDELVGIAKKFARASGLRQAELKTVGLDSTQSFQWETTKVKERSSNILELRFTREARLWELYFSSGWNKIEPASSESEKLPFKPQKARQLQQPTTSHRTIWAAPLHSPGQRANLSKGSLTMLTATVPARPALATATPAANVIL